MIQHRRALCCVFGLTSIISGCTTLPKQVDADIPMVHSSLANPASSNKARSVPDIGDSGTSVTINQQTFTVLNQYVSATGKVCKRLQPDGLQQSGVTNQSVCRNDGEWLILAPLVTFSGDEGL